MSLGRRPATFGSRPMSFGRRPTTFGRRPMSFGRRSATFGRRATSFGRRPTSYRAPSWEYSRHTIGLLEKHGIEYTSDLMDTLLPAYHTIDGRRSQMMNLPVHWVLDDLAHFFYHISARKTMLSCRQVFDLYKEEFDGIRAYGGLFVLTMHPPC